MEVFEAQRGLLFGIAYRMLGSAAEAEDVVQEAYLRWQSAARDEVRSERAYLSSVVTRLCLDQLKSARVRRETYVGPWLPEPLPTADGVDREDISLAFLVLLESLTPQERAVYLLVEVFEHDHAEVAEMLGISSASCRQLLHRARASVAQRKPRFAPSKEAHQRLLEGFTMAMGLGDVDGLKRMLASDVRAWSDGGGKVTAARRPLLGADEVARLYAGLRKLVPADMRLSIEEVNGWPSLVIRVNEAVQGVISIETDGAQIFAVRAILNPDKLAALDMPTPFAG